MLTVELPKRLTIGYTRELLAPLDVIEREPARIEIDASKCERFEPLGSAMLALSIARRVKSGRPAPQFVWPKDAVVRHYLEEVGWERFIGGRGSDREAGGQLGTLEMRQLTARDPTYVQSIADLLAEKVPGTTSAAADLIELCLNELLENVYEWAYERQDDRVALGCFVGSRWFKQHENLKLAVVDGGIGIPARLRRTKHVQELEGLHRKSDADVIIAAVTQEGLTTRGASVNERRGGLGLKTIRELVLAPRGGTLTVVSLTAKVVFMADGSTKTKPSKAFRGTAIEIEFRPGTPVASHVDEVF